MHGDRRTIVKGREKYQLPGKCTGLRVYLISLYNILCISYVYLYIIIRQRVVTQISIFLDAFVDEEIEFK